MSITSRLSDLTTYIALDLEPLSHLQLGLFWEVLEQFAHLDPLLLALLNQQPCYDLQTDSGVGCVLPGVRSGNLRLIRHRLTDSVQVLDRPDVVRCVTVDRLPDDQEVGCCGLMPEDGRPDEVVVDDWNSFAGLDKAKEEWLGIAGVQDRGLSEVQLLRERLVIRTMFWQYSPSGQTRRVRPFCGNS